MESSSSTRRIDEASGIDELPAGALSDLPPTIARDGCGTRPIAVPAAAPRLTGPPAQRPDVPRNVAARRAPAPRRRLQRRPADAAPRACAAAGFRPERRRRARDRPRPLVPRPLARLAGGDWSRAVVRA